jgi:hypothetical protein
MARLNNYMNLKLTAKEYNELHITYRCAGKDVRLMPALGLKDDELVDLRKLGESERNALIRYYEKQDEEENDK